ncbi:hypothetical protein ABPG77_002013 [Micractinium sp. CCAP 211/92]
MAKFVINHDAAPLHGVRGPSRRQAALALLLCSGLLAVYLFSAGGMTTLHATAAPAANYVGPPPPLQPGAPPLPPGAPPLPPSPPPPQLALQPDGWLDDNSSIMTNASLPMILRRAGANRERAIIFTTFDLVREDQKPRIVSSLRNLCYHLQKQQLLQHTLLTTPDEKSWQEARQAGVPALWDQITPVRKPVMDVKHWLAARFLENRYSVVFLDVDLAVLQDLLPELRNDFDVQGLGDYGGPELHQTGAYPREPVPMVIFQSTGFWYARATPASLHFFNAMGNRAIFRDDGWEQHLYQNMVAWFTVGFGDSAPPIKYRILPYSRYCNVGTYKLRRELNYSVDDTVVVHGGGLSYEEKAVELEKLGMWHPEKFQLDDWREDLMEPDTQPARPVAPVGSLHNTRLQQAQAPSLLLVRALLFIVLGTDVGAAVVLLAT